jgi:hypothetical protein
MLLRDGRWQQTRLRVFERDGWRCLYCSAVNDLQVHHKSYERGRMPWDYPMLNFLTLCGRCHGAVTAFVNRARELLSGMDLAKLSAAIDALERIAVSSTAAFEHAPDPMEMERRAGAVRASLERLEIEKMYLLALPWARERSRRVDVIDFEIGEMWDRVAPSREALYP